MRLFETSGAHILVDGQYGSTGKGALASWLATKPGQPKWKCVISNAGPNSGHTFYHEGKKHVLKQLPTFAVKQYLMGNVIEAHLSAGAIINPEILAEECLRYPGIPVSIHPNAAVITEREREAEHSGSIAAVAGTRSGTGAALARKIERHPDAIWRNYPGAWGVRVPFIERHDAVFIEVSQGFSLGINQPFYPKVTSRECTASQALADAGMPPRWTARTYMAIRTFPIRVGNVDGHDSGGWYGDQQETTWEELGVTPERTTVTNRVRRVATFSEAQFTEALRANDPDWVFLNFLNYIKDDHDRAKFASRVWDIANAALERPVGIICSRGATDEDVYSTLDVIHSPGG